MFLKATKVSVRRDMQGKMQRDIIQQVECPVIQALVREEYTVSRREDCNDLLSGPASDIFGKCREAVQHGLGKNVTGSREDLIKDSVVLKHSQIQDPLSNCCCCSGGGIALLREDAEGDVLNRKRAICRDWDWIARHGYAENLKELIKGS